MPYTEQERQILLDLALASIRHGLHHGSHLLVDVDAYPAPLREPLACFVTLYRGSELRGCIGSLIAIAPLVEDLSRNAFSSAFRDPRFPPLEEWELATLTIHISVLGKPQPIHCSDEGDLLKQLRPGIDGLILREGARTATFLPSVWESLREPAAFLEHLRMKAGLPPDYWSPNIRFERYTTESFP